MIRAITFEQARYFVPAQSIQSPMTAQVTSAATSTRFDDIEVVAPAKIEVGSEWIRRWYGMPPRASRSWKRHRDARFRPRCI